MSDNAKSHAKADEQPVLVTGASGFVAMHCIVRLLERGYRVRGTVRSAQRIARVSEVLKKHADVSRLSLVVADLDSDAGWADAVAGCKVVLHVASPVPRGPVKHEDDVIVPARDGALRVLKAAAAAHVERVVMTSSTAAVFWGLPRHGERIYDESAWSALTDEVGPYERSKTLAERAAWEFVTALPASERFELVTLQPGLVLGPVLDKEFSVSGEVIRKLMAGELPGCPDLGWAPVDVRDVADAHIAAMTVPEAAGNRFILALEHVSWLSIAEILARHFGPRGFKVPARRLPSWLLKTLSMFDKTAALVVPELGKRHDVTAARARSVLGWKPRDVETMVVDMTESMIQLGVLKTPKRRARTAESRAEGLS